MRKILLLSLLALGYQTASAQLVTESFGTGGNAFTMDFVTIGNPNNAADTTGNPNPAGSVAYTYNIGKYEVSRDMINKANSAGGLGITMMDMTDYGGNGGLKPATGITWYEAAKFVNWLNTSTGYAAAYKFDINGNFQLWSSIDAGYNEANRFRNSLAKYVITSSDEWYKGAYGSPDGLWYDYTTGSNNPPQWTRGGTLSGTAVIGLPQSWGPADINNAGGLSPYGTMGQGGNAWEINESAWDGLNNDAEETRVVRGSSWDNGGGETSSSGRQISFTTSEATRNSFRVAMAVSFALTTSCDSARGTISCAPNLSLYSENTIVVIQAIPKAGYVFLNWGGDSSATTSQISITINSNKSVVAFFSEDNADADADGLSNYQEIVTYGTNPNQKDTNSDGIEDGQAVALGYSPTFNFSALISHLQSHPPTGLYTASQMQAMAFGDLVLTKNANGSFTLNYDIEQSTDLQTWTTYAPLSLPLTGLPTDKAFVRIKAKQ